MEGERWNYLEHTDKGAIQQQHYWNLGENSKRFIFPPPKQLQHQRQEGASRLVHSKKQSSTAIKDWHNVTMSCEALTVRREGGCGVITVRSMWYVETVRILLNFDLFCMQYSNQFYILTTSSTYLLYASTVIYLIDAYLIHT